MDLFVELFGGLPRQGPGSDRTTRRALAALPPLPLEPHILDLGCGSGRQSVLLALETGGVVEAVDRCEPFLQETAARARRAGVADRVRTRRENIEELENPHCSTDLVWSEGALYAVGLERAFEVALKLLKVRGLLAFTEASWLTPHPPAEARLFWAEAYPEMRSTDQNRARADRAGFRLLESFVLPDSDWVLEYYEPLRVRIDSLRPAARQRPELAAAIAAIEREMDVFERTGNSYGYVFYILQRR